MRRQFNILACRDVSKSEFAESEKLRAAQATPGRTLLLDQDENSTNYTSNPNSSNYSNIQKRCLKLVLQPVNQVDLSELLTAFEFAGPLLSSADAVEGKILEIETDQLDLVRGTLLLYPNQCKIIDTSNNSELPDEFFLDDSFLDTLP